MGLEISIKNRRTYSGEGVYIGRPSLFGNPFVIGKDGSRQEVIEKYDRWIRQHLHEPKYKQALEEMYNTAVSGELVLICWCHPLPCHGEIVKKLIQEYASEE